MSLVHVTTRIEAPVEQVWEVVMDPQRLEQWVTIHRRLGRVSSGPLGKGSTMAQTLHMRGFNFHVNWTLVECDPPNLAQWEGTGPAHSRARTRYELHSAGENATEFEYFNDFSTPGGRLGQVASRVIVGDASEREAHSSLVRLKRLIEQA
jgi:carbon monoxide dehydrogenase subunit G